MKRMADKSKRPAASRAEQAAEILRNAGLRITACRTSLLHLLLHAREPLAQKELTASLEEQGFNRVTIYRALETFLEASIVHRIVTEDRTWRFAITLCGHRGHCHPHFTCRECGRIRCLQGVAIPVVRLQGHRIEAQAMYLWGLCPACLPKERPAP
jgi:Fur family transcriptional regulator, ferric uptake regulator